MDPAEVGHILIRRHLAKKDKEGDYMWLVYSDNIYAYYPYNGLLYSFDGSKMESMMSSLIISKFIEWLRDACSDRTI